MLLHCTFSMYFYSLLHIVRINIDWLLCETIRLVVLEYYSSTVLRYLYSYLYLHLKYLYLRFDINRVRHNDVLPYWTTNICSFLIYFCSSTRPSILKIALTNDLGLGLYCINLSAYCINMTFVSAKVSRVIKFGFAKAETDMIQINKIIVI